MYIMLPARFSLGLLFGSALLFIAAEGNCAEQNCAEHSIDRQIAKRTQQYQESLRQRAARMSPEFQSRIESQVKQTVSKGLAKWHSGEISIQIALPRRAEARRIAQFVARHFPFSGSPAGSLVFGSSTLVAAMIVVPVQHVLNSLTLPVADSAGICDSVNLFQQSSNVLSYFIRIACTIMQRR